MSEEKNPTEVAMAKDCIFIVAALIAAGVYKPEEGKCRGPACGLYAEFVSKCGFAK